VGVSMGTWFVAIALSETLATRLSKLASIDTSAKSDVAVMLVTYTGLFEYLALVGLGFGVFLLVISPLLKRGMSGIN